MELIGAILREVEAIVEKVLDENNHAADACLAQRGYSQNLKKQGVILSVSVQAVAREIKAGSSTYMVLPVARRRQFSWNQQNVEERRLRIMAIGRARHELGKFQFSATSWGI